MTNLEVVQQEIASRTFDDTYVELLPLGRDSSKHFVRFIMRNWHSTHLELVKTYATTFNATDVHWEGSPWILLDLVIPQMNIPANNVYVHPSVTRMMSDVEAAIRMPFRISADDLFLVPPLEGKKPYENFQLDSVRSALSKRFFGLFLKQGLGKSYVIATALRRMFRNGSIQRAILLTPGTGLLDIKRKIRLFAHDTFADEEVQLVTRHNRECFTESNAHVKIFVMTYSTLRLVRSHYDKKVKPVSRTFKRHLQAWLQDDELAFIPDEAHNLGNPSAQQSKAAEIVAALASSRIISTGTPADKPERYYNILKLIHPFFVRFLSFTEWQKCVANIGTAFSEYAISEIRPDDLRYFLDSAESNYVHIMDDRALELPPHYQKEIFIPLEPGRQKRLYETFSSKQLDIMKRMSGALLPRQVLNRFPYLLLSLDNPDILKQKPIDWHVESGGELGDVDDIDKLNKLIDAWVFEKDHQKVEYLYELLDEHVKVNGEKCVIWTGHPDTAEALAPLLRKYNKRNTKVLTIHGRTKIRGKSTEEIKDEIIQEYRTNDNHRVMVASYMVVETAIDLVEATCQIYFDEPYRMIQKDQSMKRLHRAGQDKPVTTYSLIFADTIDETRHAIISGKVTFDRNALDSTMPLEEWRKLFTGEVPQSLQASLDEAQNLF